MVWKKDLEKLKQALGAEEPTPTKAVPKPKPKPAEARPMDEEDRMFLSAMGHRPKPQPPIPAALTAPAEPAPAPAPPPAPEAPGAEFSAAMGGLKGMVALRPQDRVPPARPPAPAPPKPAATVPVPSPAPRVEAAVPVEGPAKVDPPPAQEPPETATVQPAQINLAAGMAVDVDASLDLKGHGRNDAEERLKERILDAQVLGWRTLHVILGPSEELRQMLLEMLKSPTGARISRFAQAPIPMGGSQAWILYFRTPSPPPD